MKKNRLIILLLIALIVVALIGCKKDEPEVVNEPEQVVEQDEDLSEDEIEDVIDGFNALIDGDSEPAQIVSYVDENIRRVGMLEGDLMIDGLEQALEKHIEDLTSIISTTDKDNELIEIAGREIFFPEERIKDIKSDKLKKEIEKAYKNMYKLVNLEGEFNPIIDYTKLKAYEDRISDEWNSYLNIRAMDSEKIPFADGAIVISFDELAKRIITTEKHLNTYVEGLRHEELVDIYEMKLNAYMKGLPNTSIADPSDKIILDEVLDSYEETGSKEGLVTSFTISEYLQVIKENDNKINEAVMSKAKELITEAIRILNEYK